LDQQQRGTNVEDKTIQTVRRIAIAQVL